MLSVYLGSFLFGGVLLGASIFGGHGDAHGDAGGHGDAHDPGHGGDHQGQHDHDRAHAAAAVPFFSLRFWAFALAFFGLSGALLTVTGALGLVTPFLAGGMGLGCGYLSARVLQSLARRPVGLLGSAESHLGREGRVLLPVQRGTRGKVRLSIGGMSTDLIAETDSEGALAPGDTALVVGMRGTVALVERSPAALPPGKGEDR
jgi:membrane protein implicated in regulation of membrane protease activity